MVRRVLGGLAVMALMIGAPCARAWQNLTGSGRLTGTDSKMDSVRNRALDQQYFLNFNRNLLPALSVRASLAYNDYLSDQTYFGKTWRGELAPSGQLTWSNPLFNLGSDYRYRRIRDLNGAGDATTRGAGAFLRTKSVRYPIHTLQYDWNRNESGSGFQPVNTEERTFQYSANYYYKTLGLYYNYTDRRFTNLTYNAREKQKQHIGRLDYSRILLKNRLRVSTNYLYNYSRREDQTPQSAPPLIQLVPVLGLYIQDETPGFGALDTLGTLIDNNLTAPASTNLNIGTGHLDWNIGFDLGLVRSVSMIFVYTDRPSDPVLSWSLYTGEDNLNWTQVTAGVQVIYNASFNRYEISFPETSSRYFKVVNSGSNEVPEVYVTEIQAYLSTTLQGNIPAKSTNHRVNASASYALRPDVQITVDGLYGTFLENSTGLQRRDLSASGNISYHPTEKFTTAARYQRSQTEYTNGSIGAQANELISLVFQYLPLQTVETSLSGSRNINRLGSLETQRLHSLLLHVSTLWVPGFSTVVETGVSRNENPSANWRMDSYNVRISSNVDLYDNLKVTTNYNHQIFSSNQALSVPSRDQADINADYRLTATIFLRAGMSYNREGDFESFIQDYTLGWNTTRRLNLSTTGRLQHDTNGFDSRVLTAGANYILSTRTNIFFNYFLSKVTNVETQNTRTFQLGLATSF